MTDDDLAVVRGRRAAITPAPWGYFLNEADPEEGIADFYTVQGDGGSWIADLTPFGRTLDQNKANAEFIAHAPDDVAALLDLVDFLRGLVHDLKEEVR
jgi:hypothetical protein